MILRGRQRTKGVGRKTRNGCIALEVASRRVETATTGRVAQAQQDVVTEVTTISNVHDARIRQIRPVLNTFRGKCVRDVVFRVQLN